MITPAERRLWDAHRGGSQRERTVQYLLFFPGWNSISDIHRLVGFCRLNSRVAEARKVFKRDGHPFDIQHSIRDGQHGYELVPLAEGDNAAARGHLFGNQSAEVRVGKETPRGAESPSASGSNLIPELGLPHAQDEDGPLILEGQGQLL